MKIKSFILAIICLFFNTYSQSQNLFPTESICLEGNFTFSGKNKFEHNYAERNDVTIYSKKIVFAEAKLNYLIILKKNIYLNTSFFFGAYPTNIVYELDEPFTTREVKNDIFLNYIEGHSYFGGEAGLSQLVQLSAKNYFMFGADIHLAWFEPTDLYSATSPADIGLPPDTYLFEENIEVNKANELIIAPRLHIDFYRVIGKNFMFKISMSGVYSNKKPIKGVYTLNGQSEVLTGNYTKKYAHAAFAVGVVYMIQQNGK